MGAQYRIIDNFLPADQFEMLRNILRSSYFPWYYIDRQSYTSTEDSFQFFHNFYREGDSPSEYYSIIKPCLQKLGGKLSRAKAVLTPKSESSKCTGYHIDYENMKTSTYYIKTNDGWTEFEEGGKVGSVANRMLIFDSNLIHAGFSCTDQKTRILINFNYDG